MTFMSIRALTLAALIAGAASAQAGTLPGMGDPKSNVLAYAGGSGNVRFQCVTALPEGAVLIGGGADHLDWLPADTKRVELGGSPTASGTGKVAFILLVREDLSKVGTVLTLPKDVAKSVRWIKTSNVPGAPTGEVFISGENAEGYFVAKLDTNFVAGVPSKLAWFYQAKAKKDIAADQPWDVGGDGRVVLATGEPHSQNWADVQRLEQNGVPGPVEHWRNHWSESGLDWQGTPASANPNGKTSRSALVFKVSGRGSLRSWTEADYKALTPDGNGGTKQGRWPWDYYFSGAFNVEDPKSSPGGPGYTGYRWGANPVGHPQAIAVDRRSNDIYVGGNNQSKLPDGQPDFEPFVIAFAKDGKQKWWQRLYKETPQNSTPDQYVDGLAIDYTQPENQEGALVVLARCHGNNVINLWNGNKIEHPKNPKTAFQNSFTGKNGNIHIGWLGRMTLAEGTMLHATYVAEWTDGAKVDGKPHSDPLMDGWPSPNGGWPDVNTTRCQPSLQVDGAGNVYVIGTGRRVITTANAHQKMPKISEGDSKWADFVRVYDRELKTLKYSSLVTGGWDPQTKGAPSSDVKLECAFPFKGGVLVAGHAPLSKDGTVKPGPDMPVANPPAWAAKTRNAEMGVIGKLHFAQ
jgi:hypothetical protein